MTDTMSHGTLWIVATPIGSLDDLAPRGRGVLETVDVILAEDTRRTAKLLAHARVPAKGRLHSFHEHNERHKIDWVMSRLERGSDVALVSDAGTPSLSDPGYQLVREARTRGLEVRSVPGASAFTAALAAAGQPPLPAALVGFLPPKAGPRMRKIESLAGWDGTLVILLSPHRLARELADLASGLGGGREATLVAEISKRYERAVMAPLDQLARGEEAADPKGEYVIVIAPPPQPAAAAAATVSDARTEYDSAIAAGMDRRSALREAARTLGVSRRVVYSLLLDDETAE
jgi:16S rRNA (cytidine1402-2'-O)-methyltransferase